MKSSFFVAALAAIATASADAQHGAADGAPLSLAEAVLTAGQGNEPSVLAWQHRSASLEALGESENTRPDPTIRVGVNNLRLSDFDPNREAMTQGEISLRQSFLRGETGQLRQARRSAQAQGSRSRAVLQDSAIRREVREEWLETYYWEQAGRLTGQRREDLRRLGEIALSTFASGRSNVSDVLRVDMETAVLDTRLVDIERQTHHARTRLARYLGEAAFRPLTGALPDLPPAPDPGAADDVLPRHPSVAVHDAEINASESEIDLARQAFSPAWSVDARYGVRDSRSDFASVGVSVEIPLFNRDAREAGVTSAREARSAEEFERRALLLDLRRDWERLQSDRFSLQASIDLYEREVLPHARETAQAVMTAYENGRADFPELVRAELALLDAELALVRLRVDALKARAGLLFLAGDVQ